MIARHTPLGPRDTPALPAETGDLAFAGLDMRAPPLVPAGFVSDALNLRLVEGVYETRRGWAAPVWTRYASDDFPYRASYLRDDDAAYTAAYRTTYGGGVFTDPGAEGDTWIVRICAAALVFTRETEIGRIVPFAPGLTVSAACQVFQNFNQLIFVRGGGQTSLKWSGDWSDPVTELVPSSVASGYAAVPTASYGLAWRERTVLLSGRDDLVISAIADSTQYDVLAGLEYVNRGRGDTLRAAVPIGASSLLVLKSQSLHVYTSLSGDLSDARLDTQPVEMQFDSPATAIAADGKVWWLDRRGVRTAEIAATDSANNVLLRIDSTVSDRIAPLIRRIAWRYAALFSAAVTTERIYFAVALDQQTTPQTLLVWNRQTQTWESYDQWNTTTLGGFSVLAFAPAVPWLNEPRLFALDAIGRQACEGYHLGEDLIGYTGTVPTRAAITATLTTRGYTGGTADPKKFMRAQVQLDTWSPYTGLTAVFDGPAESQFLGFITRARSQYFTSKADFLTSNINGDFSVARRQDYSVVLSATPASGYAAWAEGAAYVLNDNVFLLENGRNYRATQSSTGLQTNVPGQAPAYWRKLSTGTSTNPTWASGNAYTVGMQVVYQHTYECIADHTASYGTDPIHHPEYWTDLGLDTGSVRFYLGTPGVPATLSAYHSADVDRDGVISFREFERVLDLYNYRSGATRTGEYHTDPLAYSGYAPGPGAITTYHSADTTQNGRISLSELTRVIELLNSTGGAYHVEAGTEDGFAPGAGTDPGTPAGGDGLRLEDFQTAIERRDLGREAAWCQLSISNYSGAIKIRAIDLEAAPGPRANLRHS
jgi:hypothetical protein